MSRNLEEYCEYLEQEIKHLNRFIDDRQYETSTIIDVYEKALDKACEKLAFASNKHCIDELGSFTLNEINRTKEEWKEELMNE